MKLILAILLVLSCKAFSCDYLVVGKNICVTKYDGQIRRYSVFVPSLTSFAEKTPLVLDIHGYSSTALQQEAMSGMKQMAKKENFVVVWPNGSFNQAGLRYHDADFCCNFTGIERDDIGFMRMIVERVSSILTIDEKRIHATGLSNGGAMTYHLYCNASDLFTAFAPIVFNLGERINCQPQFKRPIYSFNSIQDSLIPHEGGVMIPQGEILSTDATLKRIAAINGCSDKFIVRELKGKSKCIEYLDCDEPVKHCTLDNPNQPMGGHILYFNDDDLKLAPIIWNFFKTTSSI
ncbi:MAG: hypothetical protein CME65_02485 [Halobacteriovoraceae bacterium]|nr:hypothetical protein [Halobacteriovoraceae bacterium]|tara:strand:- start:5557 stop:6429 length:873 start_codon:yes stop_codon:yes gene_type:complete